MANVTIFPRCHRPKNNTNKFQRFQVVLTVRLSRTLILNIVDVSGVHYILQVDGSNYIRRLIFILRLIAAGGIEPRILSRFTSLRTFFEHCASKFKNITHNIHCTCENCELRIYVFPENDFFSFAKVIKCWADLYTLKAPYQL